MDAGGPYFPYRPPFTVVFARCMNSTGYMGNVGKECVLIELLARKEWPRDDKGAPVPLYLGRFPHSGNKLFVRHDEVDLPQR